MGVLRRLREWREKRDGTLEGPALHTERVENAQIDDEVNYIDPTWQAQTDAFVVNNWRWETIENTSQTTDGSGSITLGSSGNLTLDTGSTDDSVAMLRYRTGMNPDLGRISWQDAVRSARFIVRWASVDGDGQSWVETGLGLTGDEGFGVRNNGDALEAFVHDGSTLHTKELFSSINTDEHYDIRFESDPDSDEVSFAVDDTGGSTETATIEEMPSGDNRAKELLSLRVENSESDAANEFFAVRSSILVIRP